MYSYSKNKTQKELEEDIRTKYLKTIGFNIIYLLNCNKFLLNYDKSFIDVYCN